MEDPDLGSDPTGKKMAQAIIKEVADMLWMRDWYALAHRFQGDTTAGCNWGPFSSHSEALKAGSAWIGVGEYRSIKLYSPGQLEARAEGKKVAGHCRDCGHTKWMHAMDGSTRGKCHLTKCGCTKFNEIK